MLPECYRGGYRTSGYARCAVSRHTQRLHGLSGDIGDQAEILVEGEDCQPSHLCRGGDEQFGDGWGAVLTAVGE